MFATNRTCGVLLDTHIWVLYINATPGLKPTEIAAIDMARKTGEAFVSVISIWEVALLVKKKRLNIPVTVQQWAAEALLLPGIRLVPFSPEIAIESVELPNTLNKDPADRIVVATARIENLKLMSHDKDILRFAKQTGLAREVH